jgi:curli biogenesis system outer membrane secretion channel CsgG
MKKYLIVLILLCSGLTIVSASIPGYWMDYGVGSRALGMSRSFVGISDDVTAISWNPAGITQVRKGSLSLMHTELYYSTRYDFLGYVLPPYGQKSFGFGVLQLYSGDIITRDENNYPGSTINDINTGFFVTGSMNLNNNIAVGTSLKVLNESFSGVNNTGYGLDIGCRTKLPYSLVFGMNIQNVLKPKLGNQVVPLTIKYGLASKLFNNTLSIDLETDYCEIKVPNELRLGFEYIFLKQFALRTGFNTSTNYPTAGIGFKIRNFGIDYAFLEHPEFGISHRATLNLSFGKSKEEIEEEQRLAEEKAQRQQVSKKYLKEAIDELETEGLLFTKNSLKKALLFDSENKEAKELDKKIVLITRDGVDPVINVPKEIITNTKEPGFIITDNVALKKAYVNDVEYKQLLESTATIKPKLDLVQGDNKVTIKAVDMNDNESVKEINVVYDSLLPVVEYISPKEKVVMTDQNMFKVELKISDILGLKEVNIGDIQKKNFIDNSYSFKEEIPLKLGTNTVNITVTDTAGNVYKDVIYINYQQLKINIAVTDFQERSPISKAEAAFISDFLRTELVKTDAFNVIEKSNMEKILAEQQFQMAGCNSNECYVQMGKMLNTQVLITGIFGKLGDQYIVTINCVDIETGKIVKSVQSTFYKLTIEDANKAIIQLVEQLVTIEYYQGVQYRETVYKKFTDRVGTSKIVVDTAGKPNMAVLDFIAHDPISLSESAFVTEFFRSGIVKSEKVNLIDRKNMEQILNEQKFQMSGCTSEDCAVEMGKILNANEMVIGDIGKLGDRYIISISLVDIENGKIVYVDKTDCGSQDELEKATNELADRLLQKIQQ